MLNLKDNNKSKKVIKNKIILIILSLLILLLFSFNHFYFSKNLLTFAQENLLQSEHSNSFSFSFASTESIFSSSAEAINEARKSVVEITCESPFGKCAGSGVIIGKSNTDNATYVITNYHIIQNSNKATLRFYDGQTLEDTTILGYDKTNDLAVIMFNGSLISNAYVANIRNIENSPIILAEEVYAIGNPLGQLGGTLTRGIISCLQRKIIVDNIEMNVIQTDASINHGNSGGGLFDNKGNLVGIVNAKVSASGVEGLGFAIPINKVQEITTKLIESHKHNENYQITEKGSIDNKSELGFSVENFIFITREFEIEKGFFVSNIDTESKAYLEGLRVQNKVYSIKINDKEIPLSEINNINKKSLAFKGDIIELVIGSEPFNEKKIIKFSL